MGERDSRAAWPQIAAMGITLAVFQAGVPARATKPCPGPPCEVAGKFDPILCQDKAQWIAVGKIRKVKHRREGDPLHKDFAEFTLRVVRWEKAAEHSPKDVKLQVGWCHSSQELPEKTDGLFRFFGTGDPTQSRSTNPMAGPQYLFFQRVEEGAAQEATSGVILVHDVSFTSDGVSIHEGQPREIPVQGIAGHFNATLPTESAGWVTRRRAAQGAAAVVGIQSWKMAPSGLWVVSLRHQDYGACDATAIFGGDPLEVLGLVPCFPGNSVETHLRSLHDLDGDGQPEVLLERSDEGTASDYFFAEWDGKTFTRFVHSPAKQ